MNAVHICLYCNNYNFYTGLTVDNPLALTVLETLQHHHLHHYIIDHTHKTFTSFYIYHYTLHTSHTIPHLP